MMCVCVCAYLKDKLIDTQLNWPDEHRVECLVACLVFGRTDVYNLPLEF